MIMEITRCVQTKILILKLNVGEDLISTREPSALCPLVKRELFK